MRDGKSLVGKFIKITRTPLADNRGNFKLGAIARIVFYNEPENDYTIEVHPDAYQKSRIAGMSHPLWYHWEYLSIAYFIILQDQEEPILEWLEKSLSI